MSFSDSRPPYKQQFTPYSGSDAIGCWPQFPMNNEDHHYSQVEKHPPFKKPRKSEESQSDYMPFSPVNARMIPPNAPVNKGTTNIFFKTRLCAKFKMGMCRNGENCNFAHGIEDMRQPPPNWQELVGLRDEDKSSSGNWEDDQKIIHRMKLCKKFYNGEECPYGDRCNFLHEDPAKFRDDMGRFRESSAISIGTSGPTMVNTTIASNQSEDNGSVNMGSDAFRINMKPVYWKTRLCNKWETTGHCPFEEKCHFAHGQAELQLPGGRVESEALISVSIGTKPQVLINESVPSVTTVSALNEDGKGKKCLLKWKGQKKINRIYADWLDDLPLPPCNLTSKVET